MKEWKIKEIDDSLANLPEYPGFILKLLSMRAIRTEEEINDFLNPDYGKLHDPFLFQDMQKSVERIRAAIDKSERICIYADYDADAITAAVVIFLALQKLGVEADCYIPDRFTEGYGMNLDAINKIKDKGVGLIITVDCGTNAVEEAKHCKDLGIDLIITDHHEVTGELPQAYALINPKNPQDLYPYPYLTGVGVAYKLVQALFSGITYHVTRNIPEGWEKWLLDLVAIGTVADCQSLTMENRILVSFGLKVLSKTRRTGLRALLTLAAVNLDKVDAYTLGFIIAPRINAAGRIKHADLAFQLLVSNNQTEAEKLAIELNSLNSHRQGLTEQILSEAKEQVEIISDKKILLASGSNWPKGVVGLVAGKLAEEYCRPVLIMERGEVYATGSARSVANFNMVEALGFSKDLLSKYGGHNQAAGFTLPTNNIGALYQKLLEYAESINFTNGQPILEADAVMEGSELTWENFDYLKKFGPFGVGNPKPKFVGYGLTLTDFRLVGSKNQHLKLIVGFGGHVLEAMAFGKSFLQTQLKKGQVLDMVFELDANEWNGNKKLQLKIVDLKIKS